jgi:hypothetical protein
VEGESVTHRIYHLIVNLRNKHRKGDSRYR